MLYFVLVFRYKLVITVVGVVFITLAVVLFSVGNFKCARVLVPIIAVTMSMGI